MGRREINAEIFQDTTEFLNESEKLLTSTAETRRDQKLILADQEIPESAVIYDRDANIIVSGKRTLEAASAYKDKKTCTISVTVSDAE